MQLKLLLISLMLVLVVSCKPKPQQTTNHGQPYVWVSMYEVLVNPEQYNWRDFVVTGFLADGYLYLSPEQAQHRDTNYAIAVHVMPFMPSIDLEELNEQWVRVNTRLIFEYNPTSYSGYPVLMAYEVSLRR